jgi:hypothetical protein
MEAQLTSDTLKYDIFIDDEIIGDLIAVKALSPDSSVFYTVNSNVDYRILFSFHISFDYETSLNPAGMFNSSSFKYIMNDDVKEENWISCSNKECYVYEGDEISKIISKPTGMTAIQLYFVEPNYGDMVFSERFFDKYLVEKDGSSYKIDFPGGSTNYYFYKNGICNKIVITTLVSDMEFKLRNYNNLLSGK